MPVGLMLRSMDSRELSEWMALYQMDAVSAKEAAADAAQAQRARENARG